MICENLRQSAEKNLKGRLVGDNEIVRQHKKASEILA